MSEMKIDTDPPTTAAANTNDSGLTAKVDRKQIDYTSHSKSYDEERFHGQTNEYLESLRRQAFFKVIGNQNRQGRVLDVGCGSGRGMSDLASIGFTNMTGLDYTLAMLRRAATNLREAHANLLAPLIRGDAFRLPFADNTFPTVVSLNFLHMFRSDRQEVIVRELERVCQPGGRIVVEFDSIHKGLFFSRYFEQRRRKHQTKFNSVWEIRKLFSRDRFRSIRVVGTELPLAYKVLKHMPRFGQRVESLTHFPPFNWLAARVFVGVNVR